MKKRSHADPASTAVVIQPRHSLGGKQASRDAPASSPVDDASHKKRLSCDTVLGPNPPLPLPPPPAMPTVAMTTHAPPLHPHHLSAYGSHNSTYGTTNVGSGNSVLLARATSGGNAAALLANTHDILLSAVLLKRAPFFKHWMPRFFCLTKSSLVYYSKNPSLVAASQGSEASHKDLAAMEKRLLRGEIARGDVFRVEAIDTFRNHPYSFVVVARKRPRVRGNGNGSGTRSALSCMFVHHKETRLSAKKKKTSAGGEPGGVHSGGDTDSDGSVMTYYMDAPREEDRKKWIKTLERWIDGESPAKLGRAIFEYIVSNEYSASKYEHKVVGEASTELFQGGCGVQVSPAAQAGRRIEEDHAVLANLIRDMHECHQEDEMIFILDQIVGEVKDGACSGYVKKLIAAAGEVKLETASAVWTTNVKAAYGAIMKALYTQRKAAGASLCEAPAPQGHAHSHSKEAPVGAPTARSSMLRPTLLKPTRQTSDGGESAPEFSFHRSYKLGRKLGSGAYSVVHIATHRSTRKQVAVKCIAKSSLGLSDVVSLKHEVDIMRTLNHPNVVPLLDYFEEPRYYYIVTPLCTGGELFDALVKRKSYTEEDARAVMKKITHAITYFHSRGVVHRDLKPENILLKTSAPGAEVMIADFGFARAQKRGEKRLTACGTPGYVAPEVVRGEAYGAEVDCWSLGVILYILLCGYPPFRGENHVAIFEKVVAAQYKFESPDWDDVSKEAKDLVRKLLTVDRSQRLTAAQVLEHAWMHPGRVALAPNVAEAKRLVRVSSDLISALSQMRKHSLTHEVPKIRPSDMDVDLLELTRESIELDVDLLDRELSNLDF